MDYKSFIKTHQQKIALSVGYLLVFTLAFGLGRMTAFKYDVPDVRIEEVFQPPLNNTANEGAVQSASVDNSTADCEGRIKGSSSLIYHLPGGSFYDRTTKPIKCFDTETQAQAAGFRKSAR